ncbi:MAG: phage terminase small subunit P27 family [Chloroflexi bacterium]|nr:phage terminase small subunit P27 family [Chloroflexota bacterium]
MPSTLRRLHGETRPSRLNDREPLPRQTAPRPPAHLDPAARVIWRRTVRAMPAGVITGADTDALACYCEAVIRYRQAASLLVRSAPLIRGARAGDLIANPLDRIMRGWADQIRLFGRELGLTPSARAGLHMEISPFSPSVADEIGLPPRFRVLAPAAGDG